MKISPRILTGWPLLVVLVGLSEFPLTEACSAEGQDPPAGRRLLPSIPSKWSVTYSFTRTGPERVREDHFEIDQETARLPAPRREELLGGAAAALEAFAFQPRMDCCADSGRISLGLKSAKCDMEVEITEVRGETNRVFTSRLYDFRDNALSYKRVHRVEEADRKERDLRLTGAWGLTISIDVANSRKHDVMVVGGALRTMKEDPKYKFEPGEPLRSPRRGQLRVVEKDGATEKPVEHSADLTQNDEERLGRIIAVELDAFSFPDEAKSARDGDVTIRLAVESRCGIGEGQRKLMIRESGLAATQVKQSIAGGIVEFLNERIPAERRIRIQ